MCPINRHIQLLVLLMLTSNVDPHSFSRTFKAKRNKTEKVGRGRFVNTIKRLTKIDPIPEIPPVSTPSPKRNMGGLNEESFAFDICQSTNLCLNNGTCIAHLNEYFCNCPNTHYGKICEFKADQTKCADHMCMNNSTCYSTKEGRIVPNLRLKDKANKKVTIFVNYECWCRHGFQGAFCEFSEATRHCMEDQCNHHGIVAPVSAASDVNAISLNESEKSAKCVCHCEEFYSGPNCEYISPCRDLDCTNNGTCVVNATSETAYCQCPTQIEILPVKVQGDQCELAVVPDEKANDDCVPCRGSFMKYLRCLLKGIGGKLSRTDIRVWLGDCFDNDDCEEKLKRLDCFNNATCQVAVGRLPLPKTHKLRDRLFLLPKCLCADGFEGNFCERKIRNECTEQPEDGEPSLRRCVHGKCVFNAVDGTTDCLCDEGFRGPRCEKNDPCVPNPCGNALCVEFPLSDTFSDEDLKHTCVCKTSQSVDEISHTCRDDSYKACLNHDRSAKCENGGNCYPCELDSPDMRILALCDEAERLRKFRCICPPGFHPPFCRENTTICDAHHCQNGASCETVPGHPLDYRCICAPGFNGTFCHISLGICLQQGDADCVHGRCVEDDSMRRGFRCDCEDGFERLNCDLAISWNVLSIPQDYFAFTYPFLAFLISVSIIYAILRKRTHGDKHAGTTVTAENNQKDLTTMES